MLTRRTFIFSSAGPLVLSACGGGGGIDDAGGAAEPSGVGLGDVVADHSGPFSAVPQQNVSLVATSTLMLGCGDASVTYDGLFSVDGRPAPLLDTDIKNIGVLIRAMPRRDAEPFGSVRIAVGKAAPDGRLDTGPGYYRWSIAVPADGVERFYVLLPCQAERVGADTAPNFGYGELLGAFRFELPDASDAVKAPRAAPSTCWEVGDAVYWGPVYRNAKGRAMAIVRFDDGQDVPNVFAKGYKGSAGAPSQVLEYIPALTSTHYPDSYTCAFANDACGPGIAYQGRSTVTIPNGADFSIAALIERYGFAGSAFILCRHVGQPNFLTLGQLRRLRDRYGWLIAYQTYFNPVSQAYQQGVKLLGPEGYHLVGGKFSSDPAAPASAVLAVETRSGMPTLKTVNTGCSSGSFSYGTAVAAQGYPVVFEDTPALPAALQPHTVYWLNRVDTQTPDDHSLLVWTSVHRSEYEAEHQLDPIDIVSGYGQDPAGIRFRYGSAAAGPGASTPDHAGILADFQMGKQWFIANGFGDGYKVWAPNQGAIDEHTEAAIEAFGEFEYIFHIAGHDPRFGFMPSISTVASQWPQKVNPHGKPDNPYTTRDELLVGTVLSTDDTIRWERATVDAASGLVTVRKGLLGAQVSAGETVQLRATAMPGGLLPLRPYYAVDVSSDGRSFRLSTRKGGSPALITSSGSGVQVNLAESFLRNSIRRAVGLGQLFSNLQHDTVGVNAIRQLVWYLDECRYWVDAGLLTVDTADRIGKRAMAQRSRLR